MKTLLAVMLAVLITSGMATCGGPVTPEQSVAAGCVTYTEILRSLTIRRQAGTLSEGDIERVDELNRIATPICTADDPPAGSVRLIDGVLLELERILVEGEN